MHSLLGASYPENDNINSISNNHQGRYQNQSQNQSQNQNQDQNVPNTNSNPNFQHYNQHEQQYNNSMNPPINNHSSNQYYSQNISQQSSGEDLFEEDIQLDEFLEQEKPLVSRRHNIRSQTDSSKKLKSYERKLAENEPLEVHEQDELINDMKAQSSSINNMWRYVLMTLGGVLIIFSILFIVMLTLYGPTMIGFHKRAVLMVGLFTLHLIQYLSLIGYIAVFYYSKNYPIVTEDRFLVATIVTTTCVSFSFILLFIRHSVNFQTAWMPAFNIIYYLASFLAFRNKAAVEDDLRELEKCKYKYVSV